MFTPVGYQALIRGFRLVLKIQGLRPHTIQNYTRDVERFAATHPDLKNVSSNEIRAYVELLQARNAPKTVYEAQIGLRRFFRFLVDEGEISGDPTLNMKLTRYTVVPQPTYSTDEVSRLVLSCKPQTREGIRDKAIVLMLFDTGVREGELVSMGMPDWHRRLMVVEGKTGIRFVPLGDATLQAVERYIRRWDIDQAPLWRGKRGQLTGSGVRQMVRRLCQRASVEDKGVHAFRRAAAAQMKRLGMQDSDILEVMGWKDVTMLRRYTAAVSTELAQAAHRRFSPGDGIGTG